MSILSRLRPGRVPAAAAVLLAAFCLLGAGCRRYVAVESDGNELPPGSALICATVESTAPRPEGLLDEIRVTAAAPAGPVLAFDNALPGAPAAH